MSRYTDAAAFALERPERPGILVALHGLTGTRAQADRYLAGLDHPELGYLAPDLRGHGGTRFLGEPADFTPSQLAVDIEDLVSQLGLATHRLFLVGVSLGATIALEILRGGSLDIGAAVFIRPAHGRFAARHLSVNALIASWLAEDPTTALDRLLASDEYAQVAAVSERAAASLRDKATQPGSAERAMRLARGATWAAFTGVEVITRNVPTLVVGARDDPLHPYWVAEEWHDRIRGSRLAELPAWDDDPSRHTALARSVVQGFIEQAATRSFAAS